MSVAYIKSYPKEKVLRMKIDAEHRLNGLYDDLRNGGPRGILQLEINVQREYITDLARELRRRAEQEVEK